MYLGHLDKLHLKLGGPVGGVGDAIIEVAVSNHGEAAQQGHHTLDVT